MLLEHDLILNGSSNYVAKSTLGLVDYGCYNCYYIPVQSFYFHHMRIDFLLEGSQLSDLTFDGVNIGAQRTHAAELLLSCVEELLEILGG